MPKQHIMILNCQRLDDIQIWTAQFFTQKLCQRKQLKNESGINDVEGKPEEHQFHLLLELQITQYLWKWESSILQKLYPFVLLLSPYSSL